MGSPEDYRRKVLELVLRAGEMTIPEYRAQCLATAAAWQDLALHAAMVERLRVEGDFKSSNTAPPR
jgi:hypothetical protein